MAAKTAKHIKALCSYTESEITKALCNSFDNNERKKYLMMTNILLEYFKHKVDSNNISEKKKNIKNL